MMRDDTKKTILGATIAAMLVVSLGACQRGETLTRATAEENGVSDGLQLADLANMLQTAPDEFSVITKRPLEMPGSFAALPTPDPGAPSPRDRDPLADARAALAIAPAAARGVGVAPSASETALLASAGAVDPSIRATLASEQAAYEAEQDIYLLDRIFPKLRDLRGETDPDAIDAEQERLRLLEAGIVPGRRAALPAAPAPFAAPLATVPATVPVPATPVDPGTGPALTGPAYDTAPTLGVLAPEPADTTPSLIYLPE